MRGLVDCVVCQGVFASHECERVVVSGVETFVCLEFCSTSGQEALEVERIESADDLPYEAPVECGQARGLFGGLMRAFRKAA